MNNHVVVGNRYFVYQKVFRYQSSVLIQSRGWQNVDFYNVDFDTNDLAFIQCTYRIPFSGNQEPYSRSRVTGLFDGKEFVRFMKYNQVHWSLNDVLITGMVFNIKKGRHSLRLRGMVDRGAFNFPHFNPGLIEFTAKPPISANLYCWGPETQPSANQGKKK